MGMLKINSWTLHHGKETQTVNVSGRFALNNVGMIRRLATLHQGIMLMPKEVFADELATGSRYRFFLTGTVHPRS